MVLHFRLATSIGRRGDGRPYSTAPDNGARHGETTVGPVAHEAARPRAFPDADARRRRSHLEEGQPAAQRCGGDHEMDRHLRRRNRRRSSGVNCKRLAVSDEVGMVDHWRGTGRRSASLRLQFATHGGPAPGVVPVTAVAIVWQREVELAADHAAGTTPIPRMPRPVGTSSGSEVRGRRTLQRGLRR